MQTYIVHPDETQEKALQDFLKALKVPFEKRKKEVLPPHVTAGIKKGQEDMKAGNTISLEEFKQKFM